MKKYEELFLFGVHLFYGYHANFDDIHNEFVITTPCSTLTFESSVEKCYEFLYNLYPLLEHRNTNFYNGILDQLTMIIKKTDNSTFSIIEKERKEVVEKIGELTVKTLSISDKESVKYKEASKLMDYYKALYIVIDEHYKINL
jgi:hypothetical protein